MSVSLLLLLLLSTFGVVITRGAGNCGGSKGFADESLERALQSAWAPASASRPRRQSTGGPMRIVTDFGNMHQDGYFCAREGQVLPSRLRGDGSNVTCAAADVLTTARRNYLRHQLIPGAVRRVRERVGLAFGLIGPLTVPSSAATACAGMYVPSAHVTGDGVADADIIVYVSAGPVETPDQIIAFAGACAVISPPDGEAGPVTGGSSYRPIVATLNFNPRFLDPDAADPRAFREARVDTATHELLHTLGFSRFFFRLRGLLQYEVIAGVNRTLFTGASALAAARAHTGCPTLPGVELTRGGDGSHWTRKALDGDLMAPAGGYALSDITVAALVDLDVGYVKNADADYERTLWGRDVGCGPYTQPCNTTEGGRGTLFCFDGSSSRACTWDSRGFGACGVSEHAATVEEPAFRYFAADDRLGGDANFDYCPRYEAAQGTDCGVTSAGLRLAATEAGVVETVDGVPSYRGMDGICLTAPAAASSYRCVRAASCAASASGNASLTVAANASTTSTQECPSAQSHVTVSTADGAVLACPAEAAMIATICARLGQLQLPVAITTMPTSAAAARPTAHSVFTATSMWLAVAVAVATVV